MEIRGDGIQSINEDKHLRDFHTDASRLQLGLFSLGGAFKVLLTVRPPTDEDPDACWRSLTPAG